MIDPFYLTHSRVVIDHERKNVPIWYQGFAQARLLAQREPPPIPELDKRLSIDEHARHYDYILGNSLRGLLTKRPTDDQFLRCVSILCLLQRVQDPAEPLSNPTSRSTLGTLLQRELTLLLLMLDPEQYDDILLFAETTSLDRQLWQINLAGASAAANVVLTLTHRPSASVFLPTPNEDVRYGIDVFWCELGRLYGISVKCVLRQLSNHKAWLVQQNPLEGDVALENRQKIRTGVQHYNRQAPTPAFPVLVHVSKLPGQPIPLTSPWDRIYWPTEIIELSRCLPYKERPLERTSIHQ